MKTLSHIFLAYLLTEVGPAKDNVSVRPVMLGAALPDIPLLVICTACLIISVSTNGTLHGSDFVVRVDSFYFGNPWFISAHHILHSPVSIAALFLLCLSIDIQRVWKKRILSFLFGVATHSIIDIFSHAEDGILIFWPLNWNYRFNSGLSQWDMWGTGAILLGAEIFFLCLFVLSYSFARMVPIATLSTIEVKWALPE